MDASASVSASAVVDTLNENSTESINGRSVSADANAQVDTLLYGHISPLPSLAKIILLGIVKTGGKKAESGMTRSGNVSRQVSEGRQRTTKIEKAAVSDYHPKISNGVGQIHVNSEIAPRCKSGLETGAPMLFTVPCTA